MASLEMQRVFSSLCDNRFMTCHLLQNILFREFAGTTAMFQFREIESYYFREIETCHFRQIEICNFGEITILQVSGD